MKKATILLSIILFVISINLQAQKKNKNSTEWNYNEKVKHVYKDDGMGYENLPKKARHYFEGVKYIEGESFSFDVSPIKIKATDKDSTLITNNIPRRITVNSFFMKRKEV